MGGELLESLADIYGMSMSPARRVCDNFLIAVDTSEALKIKIPNKRKLEHSKNLYTHFI